MNTIEQREGVKRIEPNPFIPQEVFRGGIFTSVRIRLITDGEKYAVRKDFRFLIWTTTEYLHLEFGWHWMSKTDIGFRQAWASQHIAETHFRRVTIGGI